jgi:hypothetical protein
MTESHSLCVHLMIDRKQPQVCILDGNLKPAHYCMVCAAETIGAMARKLSASYIADRCRFNLCGHNQEAFCGVCYRGVIGYLQGIVSLSFFSDKIFSTRLRRVQQKIGHVLGFNRTEPATRARPHD